MSDNARTGVLRPHRGIRRIFHNDDRQSPNAGTLPRMSARSSLYGFLLALVLLVSACSKDDIANATIDDLTKLTDDIVKTVNDAEDKKAGVAEAQKKLDDAKGELGPKMKEVMELRGFQVNDETKSKVAAGLVDNTMKMATLEVDLMMATMDDPELKAAVDKLSADHEALVSGE